MGVKWQLAVAALIFASCIVAGAALIYPPAGLIFAGVEGLAGVYVVAYLGA